MIINSLKLKNIRSYVDEEINFPEGSMMLSGDIGTGKTTILIAIEFALFGLMRGQLSGTDLLRHGKKEGCVELSFTVDNKEIIIRRELKRGKSSVTQEAGFLIMDGVKQDLTPVELKSKILSLLGYPDELLTKSKSMIYRYTVYTPQEDMKQILIERKEDRLDVLRRIFDIDKYKRIKENLLNYLKELKLKDAEFKTRIEDLETKKKEKDDFKEKISILKQEYEKIDLILQIQKKEYESKEKYIIELEDERRKIDSLKNQLNMRDKDISLAKINIEKLQKEYDELKQKISIMMQELGVQKEVPEEKLREKKNGLLEKQSTLQENLDKIRDREAQFKAIISNSKTLMEKILSLDNCPTCEQEVEEEHKRGVIARENKKLMNTQEQLKKLEELKTKREEDDVLLEEELAKINEFLRRQELIEEKKKRLHEYRMKQVKVKEEQERNLDEQKNIAIEVTLLKEKIAEKGDLHKEYDAKRKELEEQREILKMHEIKRAENVREIKTLEEMKERVKKEIEKKEEAKKELEKIRQVQAWMLKYLLNIIYLMEKQIMLKIYQEFNEYFQEWFNILIEDENLNVRLDETFTPIIEQNGYETYMENLSGGEKTSVALAYRLALNKVINDFIGTIRTKDLLILDEPTDGFSTEQLDKIREVLDRLLIKQTIIVSHEPKMESYVDHIIRVHKQEHESHVIS